MAVGTAGGAPWTVASTTSIQDPSPEPCPPSALARATTRAAAAEGGQQEPAQPGTRGAATGGIEANKEEASAGEDGWIQHGELHRGDAGSCGGEHKVDGGKARTQTAAGTAPLPIHRHGHNHWGGWLARAAPGGRAGQGAGEAQGRASRVATQEGAQTAAGTAPLPTHCHGHNHLVGWP